MAIRAALILSTSFVSFAALAAAPQPPPVEQPALHDIALAVSPKELEATDTKLVGFGTRSTLSVTTSDKRGIGAAERWVKSRFEQISKDCGDCLEIITPSQVFKGERTPKDGVEVMDVVAIQKGSDPGRYVVMTGHIDSRNSDNFDVTKDAPGADDDGSGTSAVIEAARVLSKYKFRANVVYSVDAGASTL